jgi:cytochrome oxidase Cu insertion factor (SCO1/SenC/PrrC family)
MQVKQSGAAANDYQIDHSGTLLLMDPQGNLFGIFSMPHDANSIAKDFALITKAR